MIQLRMIHNAALVKSQQADYSPSVISFITITKVLEFVSERKINRNKSIWCDKQH